MWGPMNLMEIKIATSRPFHLCYLLVLMTSWHGKPPKTIEDSTRRLCPHSLVSQTWGGQSLGRPTKVMIKVMIPSSNLLSDGLRKTLSLSLLGQSVRAPHDGSFFVIAFVHQQASLKAPTIPNPVFAWDDVLGTT